MPDENDIVFSQHSIDLVGLFKAIAESLRDVTGGGFDPAAVFMWLQDVWSILVVVLYLLAAILLFAYIYAVIRFNQLADIEMEQVREYERLYQELYGSGAERNSRIADIEEHISSERPNDWKLAIIEADIILGQVLDKAGYGGASIGDQLKSASVHAFKTLDDAWEAHKVRNQIAHEGADFILTKKMARDTITRYKRVFAEFGER